MGLFKKLQSGFDAKEVKKLYPIVDQIEAMDSQMQALTDDELKAKTQEFKDRVAAGEELDDILPEAFAVCREGAWRSLGMKHFRVQLIGGIVLHQGRISEMKTGEGKTLVATLAAYLNALSGKGVHVVTVNDYLAKRDMEWMGKLYTFLGLTVGCVVHGLTDDQRKAAYQADITYGTNNEFGFDYLRDNMVIYKEQMSQRPLNYAIVDEVDSILIDEARTPLIISGRGAESNQLYVTCDRFAKTLVKGKFFEIKKSDMLIGGELPEETGDFSVDEKDKQVQLTEQGVKKCEDYFSVENLSDPENMELNHHILAALKANALMKRDIDYIVKDGEIIIVDEFTGRLMFGRRYSNGLHQAIEAKEGIKVRSESKTLATITLQNYFRMYQKLAGMTGTAKTEEDEFREIYNMDVVEIPTNKPVIRQDLDDGVYATEKGKFMAIVNRVAEAHATGQPVLVGTISIEKSELLSNLLKRRGIKHNVLNAKQHEREASIVAEAGRKGMVTIATNMAGRGTDIILGGNPEFEAKREMEKLGYTQEIISFATGFVATEDQELLAAREKFHELHEKFKAERADEHAEVIELGGLCIIGTERHESRRIDNQLRGRSGRQGDPGCTQFFISLEDDLMRLFGGERAKAMVDKLGVGEDEPIEAGILSRSIENAQKKVEGRNFSIRKYVLQYDDVMNKQREIIYGERHKVLFGEDLRPTVMKMTGELIDDAIGSIIVSAKNPHDWDWQDMLRRLQRICGRYQLPEYTDDQISAMTEESIRDDIMQGFEDLYAAKEQEVGIEKMRDAERMLLLQIVDRLWMDHIDAMDQLREGIGLRGIGQQDPAAAYAHEGFDMFEQLEAEIEDQLVTNCYNATIWTSVERKRIIGAGREQKEAFDPAAEARRAANMKAKAQANARAQDEFDSEYGGSAPPRESKPETYRRTEAKIGRNDPCPCGSGKKYKNCCMKKDMEQAQ